MNFYRSVLGQGGGYNSYTVTTVNASGVETVHKSNCSMALAYSTFNSNIVIGNNVADVSKLLSGCAQYNKPTIIPNGVVNCSYMFADCNIFNQEVNIPDSVIDCGYMFMGARNLNSSVIIGNNVVNCSGMFWACYKLNKSITIGSKVKDCGGMFQSCNRFNQNITIPSSAEEMSYMFLNCNSLGGTGLNININCTGRTNFQFACNNMFKGKLDSKRVNVYCKNLDPLRTGNLNGSISWTAMTNGYYNSARNIYLYNNYSG